jgi:hypothetical protein
MLARTTISVARAYEATLLLTVLICLSATAHAATDLSPAEALVVVGCITALTLAFFWTGRALQMDQM